MISRGYLKDVEPKEISWLWRPYIAFGKVTLIQGDTGIGKTSLMVKVMADLSNGLYPPTMFRERLLPQETGDPMSLLKTALQIQSFRSSTVWAAIMSSSSIKMK